MSDTVVSWLLGGWSFGRSLGEAGEERGRARPRDYREADEQPDTRVVGTERDDDYLVARVRASDAVAFERLFRRYHAPLVDFAASYVGSVDDGEEVVADVFAWLWERRTTWTTTAGVSAYLFGAVRNRALNAERNRSRNERRLTTLHSLGQAPGIAAPALDPATQVERDDKVAAAFRLIAGLPERQRLILSLRWTYELAWNEIAAVLKATSSTVRSEYSRTLATLRARLEGL